MGCPLEWRCKAEPSPNESPATQRTVGLERVPITEFRFVLTFGAAEKAGKMKTLLMVLVLIAPTFAQEGTVVVYRPGKFVGSALKPSIYVDGKQVARLANGRYVSLRLAPGKHSFESSMKKEAALDVDVKPNDTVYLEMVLLPGTWRGGGRLIPVGQEDGKNALLKLKPIDGMQAEIADTSPKRSQSAPASADNAQPDPPANVTVKSTPQGADINVDGKFMGNSPSAIQLTAGEHLISIEKEGLRPWQRTVTVTAGGTITADRFWILILLDEETRTI